MIMSLFEVKIRGNEEKVTGAIKPKDYNYLIEGETFGEVEMKGIELTAVYANECVAKAIKVSNVAEVVGDGDKERWYKVKVKMIVYDPNRDKETTSSVIYLTNADSLTDAEKRTKEFIGSEMSYEVSDVSETKIFEVSRTE